MYIILIIIFILLILKKKRLEKFDIITYDFNSNVEHFNIPPFPIDVVYTWAGEKEDSDNIRLSFNYELKFSLRSVIKFMPWINKIFILMNNPVKVPSWFNDKYKDKIILLDQTVTFPKGSKLPCKNSNAIETTLHNIPGLSEHFIYMNDDFFIGRYVDYNKFFTNEGKVVTNMKVMNNEGTLLQKDKEDILKIKYPKCCKNNCHYHIPIPHLKSYNKKFINEYKDYINWIRTYNSRNSNIEHCTKYNLINFCHQLHLPNLIYLKDNDMVEIKPLLKRKYIGNRNFNVLDRILIKTPHFFCINNGSTKVREKMLFFFLKLYPEKCYFEK